MTIQERLARAKAGDVVKPTSVLSSSAPKNNLSVTERLNIAKQAELPTAPVVPQSEKQSSPFERLFVDPFKKAYNYISDYSPKLKDEWGNTSAKDVGSAFFKGGANQAISGLLGLAGRVDELLTTSARDIGKKVKEAYGLKDTTDYSKPYSSGLTELSEISKQEMQDTFEKASEGSGRLGQKALSLSQSAGNMLFTAGLGGATGLPQLNKYILGSSAAGSATNKAIEEGAPLNSALAYGTLVGATEVVAESLFGGNPLFDNQAGLVNRLLAKIPGSSKLVNFLATKPIEVMNEGLEEAISEIMEPVYQRLTYDPNADFATLSEIIESAIDGIILSGVMQGGKAIVEAPSKAIQNRIENAKQAQTIGAETQTAPNVPVTQPQSTQNDAIAQTDIPMPQEQLSQQRATESVAEPSIASISEMSKEDFKSNPPNGYKYKPSTSTTTQEADADTTNGVIYLTDKFFDLSPDSRKRVLAHELNHFKSEAVTSNPENTELMQAIWGFTKSNPNTKYFVEKNVDEVVTELLTDYQENPEWLKEKHPQFYAIAENINNGNLDVAQYGDLSKYIPTYKQYPNTPDGNSLQMLDDVIATNPELAKQKGWDVKAEELRQKVFGEQPQNAQGVQPKQPKLPEGVGAMSKSVAQVLTEAPVKKTPFKAFVDNVVDYTSRKIIDSGKTIDTIGKRTGDATLYHAYNNAKQGAASAEYMIGEAQTDFNGNKVGESLMDIIFPIKEKGKEYFQAFSDYLMHKHNVDRMTLEQRTNGAMPNKPVFGEAVSAHTSEQAVQWFEQQYPEFVDLAKKIYKYNQNLMQFRIDTGLISQEQADTMNKLYPHYVPTYRDMSGTSGATARGNTVQINTGIKKATGSERNILPIDLSMARQTMQTVQAGRRNQFGNRLLQNAEQNIDTLGEYILTLEELQESLLDMDMESDVGLGLDNTFIIYRDGKPVQMKVNKGIYDGLKAISSTGNERSPVLDAVVELNNTFKKLVTGWNPIFAPKNFLRDIQDAGLFSKDFKAFVENYPLAVKEITTNGPYWQQYKALGGIASSYFDYDKGIKNKSNWVKRNTLDRVEQLNIAIEQAPRLAEFMATVKKGNGSYENLMEGMYNAAEVTVNFGRSGTLTKQLNRTFAPFLNPSVQGASKLVRRFTETKGVKQWAGLIVRAAALAVVPAVLNQMLYKDDEEYEKINDREKDTNYLFKLGDGYWLKIPKGRALSLFGSFAQRTDRALRGEENAYAGFINTAIDQSAPNNPFTDNIVAPFSAVATNTTWYGTPIEGQRLQNYAPSERYDESTDTFSKWLGKALGYSPKKINYLLDSYTGVIGDFVLPIMTPKAEQNPFVKAFSIDATSSNKISQQFYDKADEIKYSKNETDAEPSLAIVARFYNRQSSAVSDLYSEIRDIENSKLSDKEKKVKVRELKATISAIQQNALNVVDKYAEVAKKNYIGEKPAEIAAATLQTDWEVFGAEYAIKTNLSEAKQEQAETAKKAGVPYDAFLDVVSQYQKLKPESGKKNVSLEQKLGALTSTKHSEKDKAVLIETLYDNSLLHKLDSHSTLLNIYKSTKDTSYINMTVPDKFSENKTEYVLTDSEKALYEKTFVEFMNKQGKPAPIGSMQAEQARMKKLIGLAKDRARLEVIKSRRK